jgi:hypothetical protein
VGSPSTVQQNAPFAAESGAKRGAAEISAHDPVGHRSIANAYMRDMALTQCGAVFAPYDPLMRVIADEVCFE